MIRIVVALLCCLACTSALSRDIYLTRHYEKAPSKEDPPLTDEGYARAAMLAEVLNQLNLAHIYSTATQRTQLTVKPLAETLGVPVEGYDPSKLPAFAKKIKAMTGDIFVSGHSNTTPALIKLLGGPDVSIGENDYGTLFKLTIKENTTELTMVDIPPLEE